MLHIVHTLGGCGGTLLSRCLGVLPGTALLSEVNPSSLKLYPHFDPLHQNDKWLHLLTEGESERFSQMDLSVIENFRSLIDVLHDSAGRTGRHLILRDFNYIDFIGVPFSAQPPGRRTLYDALPGSLPYASVAFIRHPIDQWISLRKHPELRASLTPSIFCAGYAAFLQNLGSTRFYKYEDFVAHPEAELQAICRDLCLPFEPLALGRFHTFDSVTGDFTRLRDEAISLPSKLPIASSTLNSFRASASFPRILSATGYAECAE